MAIRGGDEQTPPERYLTRSEVAALLGVSPTTVTRWAREGRLPCQRTLGGHHRFERAVIERVHEQMRTGAGPDLPPETKGRTR